MKLIYVVLALFLAFQDTGREIPPFEGDKNPQHNGQPKWCSNVDGKYKHNCSCQAMASDDHGGMCNEDGTPAAHGDPKCSTYCRRNACACIHSCNRPTD